jgi:hypothetical protein
MWCELKAHATSRLSVGAFHVSDPRFNVSALVLGERMIGEIVQRLVLLLAATSGKIILAPVEHAARGQQAGQTEPSYLQVPLSQVAPIGFVEPSEKARP